MFSEFAHEEHSRKNPSLNTTLATKIPEEPVFNWTKALVPKISISRAFFQRYSLRMIHDRAGPAVFFGVSFLSWFSEGARRAVGGCDDTETY